MYKIEAVSGGVFFGAGGSHSYYRLVYVDALGRRTVVAEMQGQNSAFEPELSRKYDYIFEPFPKLIGAVYINPLNPGSINSVLLAKLNETRRTSVPGNGISISSSTYNELNPNVGPEGVATVFEGDEATVIQKWLKMLDVLEAIDRGLNDYEAPGNPLNGISPENSNATFRAIAEIAGLPVVAPNRPTVDAGSPGFDTRISNIPGYENYQLTSSPFFVTSTAAGGTVYIETGHNLNLFAPITYSRITKIERAVISYNGKTIDQYYIEMADGRFAYQFEYTDTGGVRHGERYVFETSGDNTVLISASRTDSSGGYADIPLGDVGADSRKIVVNFHPLDPVLNGALQQEGRRSNSALVGITPTVTVTRGKLWFSWTETKPGGAIVVHNSQLPIGEQLSRSVSASRRAEVPTLVIDAAALAQVDSLSAFSSVAMLFLPDGSQVPQDVVDAMGSTITSLVSRDQMLAAVPTGSAFAHWLLGEGRQYFESANYGPRQMGLLLNPSTGRVEGVLIVGVNGAQRAVQFNYVDGTIVSTTDTFTQKDVKVETTKDLAGNIIDQLTQVQIDGEVQQLGTVFNIIGSSLGRLISDNQAVNVIAGGVIGTIAENIGEAIGELLLRDVDLETAISNAFNDFSAELSANVTGAGVGAISSFLAAELVKSLGIQGFGGELAQTVASTAIGTIVNNLIDGASNPFQGIEASLGSSIGSFLGAKLASEIVHFDTVGGQLGSSVGSAIGSFVVVNLLTESAAGTTFAQIGASLGWAAGPIGAFVGAFLGYLVGGLIGSLAGGGAPKAWSEVRYNSETKEFFADNIGSKNKGNVEAARNLAVATSNTLNSIVRDVIGGEVINDFVNGKLAGFYIKKSTITYSEGEPNAAFSGTNANTVLNQSIIKALEGLRIAGGDVILKRSLYSSLGQAINIDGVVTGDLNSVIGNFEIARDYESYLANAPLIEALIGAQPNSAFAAGWILTLQKAKELGLDRRFESDWYGGFDHFLSEKTATAASVSHYLSGAERVTSMVTQAGEAEIWGDTISGSGKDRISGGAGDDAISVAVDTLQGNVSVSVNGAEGSLSSFVISTAALIDGGIGNDVVVGGDLGNDILGGLGNDTLTGGKLDDWIFGGDGDDILNSGGGNGDVLMGDAGNDTLNGSSGSDWLDGGDGNDTLNGGAGDDILAGGAGVDLLIGGDGNDQYVLKSGDGIDEVRDVGTATAPTNFNKTVGLGNWAGRGALVESGDSEGGASGATVAAGGEDTVVLGAGISMNDIVLVRSGTTAAPGNDLILKVRRYDAQNVATYPEQFTLKNWFDPFQRIEFLQFADGQKIRIGDYTTFTMGTAGNDVIIGTNGNDFVNGGAGNDRIELLMGNDFGAGDRGVDFVAGDAGNDIVVGGDDNDRVMGGAGNDVVSGDGGDDWVSGDDGNDIVTGGRGNDNVSGGAGDDIFRFNRGDGRDTLVDARAGTWETVTTAAGQLQNGYVAEDIEVPEYDSEGNVRLDAEGVAVTRMSRRILKGSTVVFDGTAWKSNVQYDAATGTIQRLIESASGAISDQGTDTLEFAIGIDINDIHMEWQGNDLVLGVARSGASVSAFASISDQIRLQGWASVKGIEKFGFYNTGQLDADLVGQWGGGTDGNDTIAGTASMDWITGNGGDDTISGAAGDDILNGNGGLDTLKGEAGNDRLLGGAGNDVLDGGAGDDTLVGGDGLDVASYVDSTASVGIYLDGRYANAGADVVGDTMSSIEGLTGSNFADVLAGDTGENELAGGGGNDQLYGELGDDTYRFGRGDGVDTVVEGGVTLGNVTVRDEAGNLNPQFVEVNSTRQVWIQADNAWDTVDVLKTVNIKTGAVVYSEGDIPHSSQGWAQGYTVGANGAVTGPGEIYSTSDAGKDTLELGENIYFGDLSFSQTGNDITVGILGTSDSVKLVDQTVAIRAVETLMLANGQSANLGGLKINSAGGSGDDFVVGDVNANSLTGAGGNDVLSGSGGSDQLDGGDGDDLLDGGDGADALTGGAGVDTVSYTGSDAAVSVNLASSAVSGGEAQGDSISGIENVIGSDFNDTLTGSTDANNLVGGKGSDTIAGGDGDDVLSGGDGDDTVSGQIGNDIVQVGAGNDIGSGGDGNDLVFGDDGNDTLTGDAGTDKLYGGAGNDSIDGGTDNDELYGGDGNDSLVGGAGNDTLFGEVGTDALNGGDGDDVYAFSASSGADSITDTTGKDVIVFDPSIATSQIWFKQVGNDLQINVIGTTTVVTVTGYFTQTDKPAEDVVVGDKLLYLSKVAPLMALMTGAVPATVADVPTAVKDVLDQYWHVDGKAKPFVADLSLTMAKDVASSGTLSVTDHDDNFQAFGIDQQATHGTLTLNATTGAYTYTPTAGYEGYDQAVISATDADGQKTLSSIALKVGNFAPVISAIDDITVPAGLASSVIPFSIGDVETAATSLTLTVSSSNTTVLPTSAISVVGTGASRTITVSPPYTSTGSATVTLTVSDGAKTTIEEFVVTVPQYNTIAGTAANDALTGTVARDLFQLNIGGGNDTASGGAGDDTFQMGATLTTADVLDGGTGRDALNLDGNYATNLTFTATMLVNVEDLYVTAGNSYNFTLVDANVAAGTVFTVFASDLAAANTLTFSGAAELDGRFDIRGGAGADTLTGGAGNDTFAGGDGNDVIQGGAGADSLAGGSGDDLLEGGSGADAYDGGAGDDLVSYAGSSSAVTVDLQGSTQTGGDSAGDTYTGIESVSGSALNDIISGDSNANRLYGQAGDDTLSGRAGNDVLFGGDGNDWLEGGAGSDTIDGGLGTDIAAFASSSSGVTVDLQAGTLSGGDAAGDTLTSIEGLSGSASVDVLQGNASANTLYGQAGNDTLEGRDGDDTLVGGAGNDTLRGGLGSDTYSFSRGDGADSIENSDNATTTTDRLQFGSDIAHNQLWFQKVGNDLLVTVIGTTDTTTLKNWYETTPDKLDEIRSGNGQTLTAANVQSLVTAMASYTPPAIGQTTLPTSLASALGSTINIAWGVNNAPTISAQSRSIAENSANGTSIGSALTATDPDPGTNGQLVWSIVSGNTGNVFALSNSGLLTVSGPINYEATPTYSLVVQVQDQNGAGLTSQANVTVTITNVNEAPIMTTHAYSRTSPSTAGTILGSLSASDPEGTALTYQIMSVTGTPTGTTGWYSVNSSGQLVASTSWSSNNATGTQTVTVKATDATGLATTTAMTVTFSTAGGGGGGGGGGGQNSPIVLDLNGDGINILPAWQSRTRFDVDNDGHKEWTGWIGAGDGLLVLDRNKDGMITNGTEISFVSDKPGATSDLDGLSAFDSNKNGLFDTGDQRYSEFMVWLDRNRDGRSDATELKTLAELNITSINLTGTPTGDTAGPPSNSIVQTANFTRSDGTTGTVGDVKFGYFETKQDLIAANDGSWSWMHHRHHDGRMGWMERDSSALGGGRNEDADEGQVNAPFSAA